MMMITNNQSNLSLSSPSVDAEKSENQIVSFSNFYTIASLVCSCLIVITAVFGIVGNAVCAYVFNSLSTVRSINKLLVGQSFADIGLLITATPVFAVLGVYPYFTPNAGLLETMNILTLTLYPLSMMCQMSTVWTMVVIMCERFIAVYRPFQAKVYFSSRKARLSLIVVNACSVAYNVCRFFEYRLIDRYQMDEDLRANVTYMEVYYNWMYFFVIFLVPFLMLAVLNAFIVKIINMAEQRRVAMSRFQRRENRTSLTMVVVTCSFLACNLLALVLKTLDAMCLHSATDWSICKSDQPYHLFLIDFNNFLVELNSSIPFFIYYSFDRRFRFCIKRLAFCFRSYMLMLGSTNTVNYYV